MKNILILFSAWVISLALPVSLFAQEAATPKSVPGGLSSKKGSGKIFPPGSRHLQVAGHDA